MPYEPTAEWFARLGLASVKTPVFVLTITDAPFNLSSGPVKEKTTGGSDWDTAATPLRVGTLSVGRASGTQIQPGKGRYSLEDLSVAITDKDGLLTTWVATEESTTRVYMKSAALYLGDAEHHEDEYQAIWSGLVEDLKLSSDGLAFELTLFSRLREWEAEIMTGAEEIRGSVTSGDASSPFDTFAGNSDLSSTDDAYNGWTLIWTSGANEGDEATVSDYTGSTRTFTLSSGATNAIGLNDRFKVANRITVTGNPVNIFVRILLDDFATAGAIQTSWPLDSVVGSPDGLSGFTSGDLDTAAIQDERDTWFSGVTFSMKWTKKEKASDFFEKQIFSFLDAYPVITPAGKIRIRSGRPVKPPTTPFAIEDRHSEGAVPSWSRRHDELINEIEVQYDYNEGTDEFQTIETHTTPDTRYTPTALGVTERRVVKLRGVTTANNGASLVSAFVNRLFNRFGRGGPERVSLSGPMVLGLLEAGERVTLTHAQLPNISTGTRGKVAEAFEVTKVSPTWDPDGARAAVDLTSFYPGKRAFFMNSSDLRGTHYDDATEDDHQYGFFGTATGKFADGSNSYTII